MRLNAVVELARDGEIAVVVIDNPPVNALSADVRDGVWDGLGRAIADPEVAAVVLMCAGRTFVAGGDIGALGSRQGGAPMREIAALMERSPKPVVAAIHGSALGGGFELCLAAHWRVATPTARVGLPEVKLGILPGAGGTQRLPRLTGAEKALEMIVFGEPVGAREALAIGAVDALLDDEDVARGAAAFARRVLAEGRPLRRARDAVETVDAGRTDPGLFDRFVARHPQTFRTGLAPAACLRSVRAAFALPFEAGLDLEREITEQLIPSLESRALRHIFFAERGAFKVAGAPPPASLPPLRKLALRDTPDGAFARALAAAGVALELVDDCDLMLDLTGGAPSERWIGLRGFDPAAGHRFVEVVRSDAVRPETAAQALQLLKRLGKLPVLVKPEPGGVAARSRRALQAAAEALVAAGAATPAQVDAALYGFGFEGGVLQAEADGLPTPNDESLVLRLLAPIVDDAARLLEAGAAPRAADLDLMWVAGLGWPAHRGGPLFWAEHEVGLAAVLDALQRFGSSPPCALLQRLAAEEKGFADA